MEYLRKLNNNFSTENKVIISSERAKITLINMLYTFYKKKIMFNNNYNNYVESDRFYCRQDN